MEWTKEKIEKVAVAYYFQFIESDSVFITVAVIVMVCSCEYVVVTSKESVKTTIEGEGFAQMLKWPQYLLAIA